ncbi:hypothetical protein SOVF_066120 [Spinacia oleracea]|nr:hypothetical protein SOVF_066120 [Spinacia oleracea]
MGNSEDVWSQPNWPPRLEKVFVELLLEEMKMHDDVCATGFSEQVWDHVCQEFRNETGSEFDKKELKKHLAVLKKRYRIVKPLYTHPGFGWDYRRKMVDVDYELWKDYIEVHPEAAPYRKYGCPLYDDLCTIFTKPIATGKYAFSPGMITPVTSSISRASNNKRKSSQPLGSVSGKRIAAQNTEVGSKTKQVATSRPNEKCIIYLD